MKKIFLVIFGLIMALTSLASFAQTTSTSPVSRAMAQLQALKQTEPEKRSNQAMQELISDLVRLSEKDHNQFLFSVLKMYEKDFSDRNFLIELILKWENAGSEKTRDFMPASAWYHAANVTVAVLGALTVRKMVKGTFITAPLNKTPNAPTINLRLREFLEQKITRLNLGRLATKANLISNASGASTFVGLMLLMDEQFYDALIQGLHQHVGAENIEFFQILYSKKIPPYELWQMIDVMILCENHNRLIEISGQVETQEKTTLNAYLEEINTRITPNLESIASNAVNEERKNRLMQDGLKTRKDKQLQFALKNIETKAENPFAQRILMCDQTSMMHTMSNKEHLKFVIESKIKDQ